MAHFMQHCRRGKNSVWLLWNLNNVQHGKWYILTDNKPSTVHIRKGFCRRLQKVVGPCEKSFEKVVAFQ